MSVERQSPAADRTLQAVADCEECEIERTGWQPREWFIHACEAHSLLLERESHA